MMRKRYFPITELYIVVGILIILLVIAVSSLISNGVAWWLAVVYAVGGLFTFVVTLGVLGVVIEYVANRLKKKKKEK